MAQTSPVEVLGPRLNREGRGGVGGRTEKGKFLWVKKTTIRDVIGGTWYTVSQRQHFTTVLAYLLSPVRNSRQTMRRRKPDFLRVFSPFVLTHVIQHVISRDNYISHDSQQSYT